MKFDLTDIKAFVTVAKLGSFTAAAGELHLSQPALSRRIEKLEGALNTKLLKRTTRKVDTTIVGREFYQRATELLHNLDASLLGISEVSRQANGEVTISCMPSAMRFFVPRILRVYHELYPGITIRVIDQGASDALPALIRREVDFAFNYMGTPHPQLTFVPLLKERFVVACQPDHPLAGRKKVRWADLVEYDYMSVTRASSNRLLIDAALNDLAVKPRSFCEAQHVSTLVALVEAGVGIAVVPEMCMPIDDHPGLVRVDLTDPPLSRKVGLIHNTGTKLPPAAQKLYDQMLTLKGAGRL
jgi:DNA-binding transcriptional LysR family regulator